MTDDARVVFVVDDDARARSAIEPSWQQPPCDVTESHVEFRRLSRRARMGR